MRFKLNLILSSLLLIPTVIFSQLTIPEREKKEKAIAAATQWLKLVDSQDYDQSWETAAEFLKSSIPKKDFISELTQTRSPLGQVESRKLKSVLYTTKYPRAKGDEFVSAQYTTIFEDKALAIETVSATPDKNGDWKIGDYYIR